MTATELLAWLDRAIKFSKDCPGSEIALRDFETDFAKSLNSREEYQYLAVYAKGVSCTLTKSTGEYTHETLKLEGIIDAAKAVQEIAVFYGLKT